MKLEGIDPEHPSRYCVLTVVEVVGKSVLISFFYICYIKTNSIYLNYIYFQVTEYVYISMDI